MISYQRAYLSKQQDREFVYREAQKHFENVNPGGLPERIQVCSEQIVQLEKADRFFSIKAIKDKQIVGYIAGYIDYHMQYCTTLFSMATFITVVDTLPLRERVEIVKGLIEKFEKVGKYVYAVEYTQISLSAGKDIRKLLHKIGYADTEYILTKKN